jgi:hypothetical protein
MAPDDNSAAQARPSRRTARANAGTGGRADQLEVIGRTLERPSRTTRPMTTVPQDAPVNPMAPTPVVRKKKAGGKRNVKDPARLFDVRRFHYTTCEFVYIVSLRNQSL